MPNDDPEIGDVWLSQGARHARLITGMSENGPATTVYFHDRDSKGNRIAAGSSFGEFVRWIDSTQAVRVLADQPLTYFEDNPIP